MDPCTNECCATRARMSTCYYIDPGSIPSACTVPAHNTTAYDEALSLRLLRLAAASYCNVTALQAWQCRPCVDASFRMHTVLRDFDIDLQVGVGRVEGAQRGLRERVPNATAEPNRCFDYALSHSVSSSAACIALSKTSTSTGVAGKCMGERTDPWGVGRTRRGS
jgi:hypothetical protein